MRKIKGRLSEDRVEGFLKNRGFEVLARNYRKVFGEIDIIAYKDGEVWFVEVKTHNPTFNPMDKIDHKKLNRMLKVAGCFMEERGISARARMFLAIVREEKVDFVEIDAW
ncbi:MAG: YraN family protein [candidate division WOR-3 bacterium]